MKKLTSLLLLALALTLGTVSADEHAGDAGDAPAAATEPTDHEDAAGKTADEAETNEAESADVEKTPAAAAEESDLSAEAEEAGVGAADTDGDLVVSDEEADAAFAALEAEVGASTTVHANETAEFLASRDDMSLFLLLLDQAGITETLTSADRPITIFAPNDAAFAKLDRLQFAMLLDDPAQLRPVLQRHIVTERVSLADMNERLSTEGSVAGGGAGDQEVAAEPDGERSAADAAADDDATATVDPDSAEVAAAADAARLDPNSFVRLTTRAGADLEIGRLAAADRSATDEMQTADISADGAEFQDSPATEVAGGGAADEPGAEAAAADDAPRPVPGIFYVEDAKIIDSDLSAGDVTIHVVDAVLLMPMAEEEAAE